MTYGIPRLGDPGVVTVYAANMDREWHLTAREHALLLTVAGGRKFDQRTVARIVGYSLSRLNDVLRFFARIGFGRLTTKRGRYGWTRFVLAPDVQNRRRPVNVRPAITSNSSSCKSSPVDAVRTLTPAVDGMRAWEELRERWQR